MSEEASNPRLAQVGPHQQMDEEGPPITAVTTPTGRVIGSAVRATRSAPISSRAPTVPEAAIGGVGHFASRIATWGATSATNGTGPAALTATPASNTAHSSSTARTLVYRTPRPAATSSPRCSGLNWNATTVTTTIRARVHHSATPTSSHDRLSSRPTSQAWARATSLMSAVTSNQVVIASITALTEMPMRMSRKPSIPRRHARK